jgi:hypothetical protein
MHEPEEDHPPVETDLAGLPDDDCDGGGPLEGHVHHIIHINFCLPMSKSVCRLSSETQPSNGGRHPCAVEVAEDGICMVVLLWKPLRAAYAWWYCCESH